MAPITFGSMTMAANVDTIPKGLRTSNDQGIGFIQQMNSTFTAAQVDGQQQGPQGKLTADVADAYKNIKASMDEQPQQKSIIGRIASFFVDRAISNATKN